MKRVAFTMKLKPGCADIYKQRHAAIWPSLTALLKDYGVCNYSIFLDESTNTLFAVQEILATRSSQDLGSNKIVQKWWAYMADIMETNNDHSPVSETLEEMFYMP